MEIRPGKTSQPTYVPMLSSSRSPDPPITPQSRIGRSVGEKPRRCSGVLCCTALDCAVLCLCCRSQDYQCGGVSGTDFFLHSRLFNRPLITRHRCFGLFDGIFVCSVCRIRKNILWVRNPTPRSRETRCDSLIMTTGRGGMIGALVLVVDLSCHPQPIRAHPVSQTGTDWYAAGAITTPWPIAGSRTG